MCCRLWILCSFFHLKISIPDVRAAKLPNCQTAKLLASWMEFPVSLVDFFFSDGAKIRKLSEKKSSDAT